MYRLTLYPILGGEDEPKGEGAGAGDEAPTKEDLKALNDELRKEQGLRKRIEERLLDPTYVEFLTTRMQGGETKPKPEGKPTADEPDWDAMSTKDVVAYLDKKWQAQANELVQGLRGETGHERSVRVINETAQVYPDFWEHGPILQQIGVSYPDMHPEHAYFLAWGIANHPNAKARKEAAASATRKADAEKEPVAVGGEAPTNRNRSTKIPAAPNGPAAFATAWKRHVGAKDTL